MIDAGQLRVAADRLLERPLAAPTPLSQLEDRVARIRHRRVAVRVASALMAAVLAGGVSLHLVDRSNETRVRMLPPAGKGSPKVEGPSATRPGPSAEVPSGSSVPEPRAVAGTPNAEQSADQGSVVVEGCTVRSESDSSGNAGPVMTPDVESGGGQAPRTCSYTATRAGGYEGSGTWSFEIERGGRTLQFDSVRSPSCGSNVIRPGDHVTARLGLRETTSSPAYASTGKGEWHLTLGSTTGCP